MVTRYATFGSAAYDLNRSAQVYADAPAVETPAPRRRQAERVKARPAVKRHILGKAVTAFAIFMAVGLIVLNLLSYAMLVGISEKSSEYEAKYIDLQEQRAELMVQYEQTFDMKQVEDYAVNELGMIRPGADQTIEIDQIKTDKAVTYSYDEEPEGNAFTDITNFVAALLAYFK